VTAYDRAFEATLGNEGGYSNHPGDPGGETWQGISRRRWPEWSGWSLVDRLKRNRADFPDSLSHDHALAAAVKAFYLSHFWAPLRCSEMHEAVAAKVFDIAVNTGTGAAVRMLQAAAILAGSDLRPDGKLGPATLAAVGLNGPDAILKRLRAIQAGYYVALVVKVNPKLDEFLYGWIRRAAA